MEAKEAWHRNMKETRTEKPTLGKNGIQSDASRLVGGYHNGLVQALGHKEWNVLGSMGEGLRESFRTAGIIRCASPGLQIRGAG